MAKTLFYVFAGVALECEPNSFIKNIKQYGTHRSANAAVPTINEHNFYLGYSGRAGDASETCEAIEYCPFKPLKKSEIVIKPKTILRKKAVA